MKSIVTFSTFFGGNKETPQKTEYRKTVHLLGATSSPGCANLALRTAADDGVNEFGAEAASFVKENFYVFGVL